MTQGQEQANPQAQENGSAGQGQGQSPDGQQQQPQEDANAFLARTGFKSLADMEKSYKEAQAKITKTSQEKAQLEQALQGIKSQSFSPPRQQSTASGQGVDFFDDPEGHVVRMARQIASEEIGSRFQQLEAKNAIDRVRAENPAKFDALRPYMQKIYTEKPWLNNLAEDGLRQAYQEAETARKSELEMLKAELFPEQAGNQQDVKSQARQEVLDEIQRNQQATIPQGGVSRPIVDDLNKKRAEAIEKGDLDALLDMKFDTFSPNPTGGGRPI